MITAHHLIHPSWFDKAGDPVVVAEKITNEIIVQTCRMHNLHCVAKHIRSSSIPGALVATVQYEAR